MKDPKEARARAGEFDKLWRKERALIGELNDVLRRFSFDLDPELQKEAVKLSLIAKETTKGINLRHAAIVKEYEAAEPLVRKAFIQALFSNLPKNHGKGEFEPDIDDKPTYDIDWVQSLFDRLIDRTVPHRPEKNEEVNVDDLKEKEEDVPDESEDIYRYRYLAYSLQSLGDEVGVNQIRHLVHLLGDQRKLVVAEGVSYDMSAGPVNIDDKEKGTKLDQGGKENDVELMEEVDGNLFLFLQRKFSDFDRQENPKAGEIGNVQVNLDKDSKLFPIFPGIVQEHVFLFTTPKFVSVHHENGHIISLLEGKAALGNELKYKEALASVSDQEEAFNIFGGQRSDKAYSQFSHLPVRFDHKTLLQYLELSKTWDDWANIVRLSWERTYKSSPKRLLMLQRSVVACLGRIVNASWSEHTKKGWTPAGVKAIKKAMGKAGTTPEKLAAAQKVGLQSAGAKSEDRAKVTQEFYDLVAGLNVDDIDNLDKALPLLVNLLGRL